MSDIFVECYGLYLGSKGGEHKIYINHRIAGALPHTLNPTIIHELRHLYWEIMDPGVDHEKDCYDAEVAYEDFALATLD